MVPKSLSLKFLVGFLVFTSVGFARNVLITGYWPPTAEMLVPFSKDPKVNPNGWIGENWTGKGHDIYAYFPPNHFPVAYAETFNDFIFHTSDLNPIAILSFGQGDGPWEIETVFPNFWKEMFLSGKLPGEPLEYPIPEELGLNITRRARFPSESVAHSVNTMTSPHLRAWIDNKNSAGSYLCGFLGYLGAWYKDQHSDPEDPNRVLASTFIHVSGSVTEARASLMTTLEALLNQLDESRE